jgi:hypothetical protein
LQLDYAIHPSTKAIYRFPRRQMTLSAPNARRNPVFIVPGGGPVNPRGSAAFDRDVNTISYQFRLLPMSDGTTFDAQRDALLVAVGHGRPQTLAFLADDGRHWTVRAALVGDPLSVTTTSTHWADVQLNWVQLSDYLTTVPAGTAIWGRNAKWGNHAKWGSGALYPLNANPAPAIVLDNAANAATAATTDPVLRLTGPFGPAVPSATDLITVACAPSGTSFTLRTNLPTAADTLDLDFRARRVLRNGQAAFGLLGRPATQQEYISFLPGVVNTVTVSHSGTRVAPPTGTLRLTWNPKRSL